MAKETTRFLQEEFENFFEFLDGLRNAGLTNMYGAGPYVEYRFDLDKHDSKTVVRAWMKTFGNGTLSVKDRAKQAYEAQLPKVS
jgi:hypothetical protein